MADVAKVKRNIQKMIDLGAPESDIDAYVAEEGLTPEALRAAPATPPAANLTPEAAAAAEGRNLPTPGQPGIPLPTQTKQNSGLRFGAQAVGEGIAGLAGFPVDAATAVAVNPLIWAKNSLFGGGTPFVKEPVAGSEFFKNTIVRPLAERAGGAVDPESLDFAERALFEGLGAGAGGVIGGAGMLAGGVRRAGQIASQKLAGEKIMPQVLDRSLKTYADAPVASVVRDGIAGVGSGFGLAGAKELPEEVRSAGGGFAGMLADMVGSIGGGVGATATQSVAQAGARQAGNVVGAVPVIGKALDLNKIDNTIPVDPDTLAPTTKRAGDMAAEIRRDRATRPDEAAARLEANRAELQPVLGDRLPSPGAMAEDPGVVALEREIAMRNPAPFVRREQEFNAGVRDAVDGIARDGDPVALQNAASAEAARLRAETQAANEAAIAERQARVGTVEGRAQNVEGIRQADAAPLAPYQSADAAANASRRLDEAVVDQTYLPDRARKNELYDAVDPNRTEMVDTAPLTDAAARVRQQINELGPQAQQLPAEFVQRIERLAPDVQPQASPILGPDGQPVMRDVNVGGPGEAAVGDIVDLQKYTGKARESARASGNFALADSISELRRGANTTVEGSPAAAEATTNYRENFAPKYRPGPGDEMAKFTKEIDRDPTRSTTPPTATAGRFLSSQEKVGALRRVLDDSPAGAQGNAAVRDYLLSDLATSGVIDQKSGFIRPDRLRAWRNSYGSQLEAAPGFGAEVDSMISRAGKGERVSDGLAAQIKEAQTKLKETERAAGRAERQVDDRINKGALGAVIDADPDMAVYSIMQKPESAAGRLRELAALTANNADARAGLKAAVRDYMVERSTTTAVEKLPPGDARGPLSPAKAAKTLPSGDMTSYDQALAAVYSPEEMNALRVVRKALELNQTERVRTRSGSDTVEKKLSSSFFENAMNTPVGRAGELVARWKYGMLAGGGMIATTKRFLANMTPEDSKQAMKLLERAAIDPDLAMLLDGRKIKAGTPEYANTVQRVLGLAAGAREAVSEDEDQPLEVTVKKRPGE